MPAINWKEELATAPVDQKAERLLRLVARLLAAEGVSAENADAIILAEIADELGLGIDDVRRIIAAEFPGHKAS